MPTELFYLALVTVLTGLLWVPYILDRVATRGLMEAVGYPENPKPHSKWAQRLMKAHANAVENLIIFATLVLIAHVTGVTSPAIGTAAMIYFWARSLSTRDAASVGACGRHINRGGKRFRVCRHPHVGSMVNPMRLSTRFWLSAALPAFALGIFIVLALMIGQGMQDAPMILFFACFAAIPGIMLVVHGAGGAQL